MERIGAFCVRFPLYNKLTNGGIIWHESYNFKERLIKYFKYSTDTLSDIANCKIKFGCVVDAWDYVVFHVFVVSFGRKLDLLELVKDCSDSCVELLLNETDVKFPLKEILEEFRERVEWMKNREEFVTVLTVSFSFSFFSVLIQLDMMLDILKHQILVPVFSALLGKLWLIGRF